MFDFQTVVWFRKWCFWFPKFVEFDFSNGVFYFQNETDMDLIWVTVSEGGKPYSRRGGGHSVNGHNTTEQGSQGVCYLLARISGTAKPCDMWRFTVGPAWQNLAEISSITFTDKKALRRNLKTFWTLFKGYLVPIKSYKCLKCVDLHLAGAYKFKLSLRTSEKRGPTSTKLYTL